MTSIKDIKRIRRARLSHCFTNLRALIGRTHPANPSFDLLASVVQGVLGMSDMARKAEDLAARTQGQLEDTHAKRVHDNSVAQSTIERMKTEHQVLNEAHTRLLEASRILLHETYLDLYGTYHYSDSSGSRDRIRKALEYIGGAGL